MKKITLSLIAIVSLSWGGELSKVSHSKLQFYIDSNTETCESTQVLVENATDKVFKNKSDAISHLIKNLEKDFKGKCKILEDKDEKSLAVQCSNKKDDDSLNLIFFADRDSCTVWNEKDIAHKAFEESNSYQISSVRNNLKNFQYLYFEEQKDCLPTLDVFNYQMDQSKETKVFVAKDMSQWLESVTNIWNWSETEVSVNVSDTTGKIESKSKDGSIKVFYYGSTLQNCKEWQGYLQNK